MRILTLPITPELSGQTVRHLLRQELGLSSSLLKSLKWRENAILLNGSPVTVRAIAREGDVLTADVSDPPAESPVVPVDYPLDILWEDEDLLILNKPAGITVHSAALTEETVTVAGAVAHYLGCDTFHPVNRLDRGVTGVMVVAKNGYMHQRCMAILHTGDFRREYRGICDGVPQPPAGTIDLPISRQPGSLLKRSIDPDGLPSRTEYEVLSVSHGRTLLRLTPTTGRTHQLRVHMAAIGHPLTGDWLYGTEDRALIARPALHSYHLRMLHPVTGAVIDATAPLPEDIQRLLKEERL